jgi:hypothetical protein
VREWYPMLGLQDHGDGDDDDDDASSDSQDSVEVFHGRAHSVSAADRSDRADSRER